MEKKEEITVKIEKPAKWRQFRAVYIKNILNRGENGVFIN